MKDHILALEERLRKAQLNSDLSELDELISEDLQFILFDGSVISKEDDLTAHRNRMVVFNKIDFSEQIIHCFENFATVTVKAEVVLKVGENTNHIFLRYGRTWGRVNETRWQVISGNVTSI